MSRIPVHVSSSAVHGAYISRTTLGMVAPVLSLNDFVYSDIMLNMSCLFVSRSNDNAHGLATSFLLPVNAVLEKWGGFLCKAPTVFSR
jgi:hypothetical protein